MKKYFLLVNLSLIMLLAFCHPVKAKPAKASWYGGNFHGKKTASGERFDQNAMTTAHNSLPFGTIVRVSYKGKSALVRVNDTGGFAKYGRQFDLSKGAAEAIGCPGVCQIDYEVISKPKLKNSPKTM